MREILKMSLKEKIALCSGENFWHTKAYEKYDIPSMMVCDGPHGLRKQENEADMLGVNASVPATCFPTASITGCSFDENLINEIGEAIAEEARAYGVNVVLGPGVNVKRNPLCGRNFEYFSEDPLLAGKMGAAFIRGAERVGIGTSLKHFAANNQEYKRFSSDSIMDDRTLREIYLKPFEIAVKEGKPSTVMCAYNKINGTHCSDSRELLTDILRTEWGFDGMVLTDWGAMSDRRKGFHAGCDLNMPGGAEYMEKECEEAVTNGTLSEQDIELSVERIAALAKRTNSVLSQFDNDFSSKQEKDSERNKILAAHYELAKRAAAESAVLMKNEDNILPVKEKEKILLIGNMAENMRYQGSGSSHINPWKLTQIRDILGDVPFVRGYNSDGSTNNELLLEAGTEAKKAEKVILVLGLTDAFESEGFDRTSMKLPEGMNTLVESISRVNENVAVVILAGSSVELPWEAKVKSILYMGLSGEAGASALADMIYGRSNPSGKLAETWVKKYEDCISSSYYGHGRKDAWYLESIYVGYRYYDKAAIEVQYPFGHGLSYTSFEYSNMEIVDDKETKVTVTVKNIGALKGKEVVQLYVGAADRKGYRPIKELNAFRKVELNPGESTQVEFYLDCRAFQIWKDGFVTVDGEYEISIGSSSRDIRLQKKLSISGKIPASELADVTKIPVWYSDVNGVPVQADLEKLLGRKIVEKALKKGSFTMENTVVEMKDYSLIMKIMFKAVEKTVAKGFDGKIDYSNPEFKMMMNSSADSSLSSMKICGGMKNHVLEGMLLIANGHLFRGIAQMMK